MLKIFYGENRILAQQEITKFLGKNYEIIEGPEITAADLPSIFLGNSLFTTGRSILIRDLGVNKPAFDKLPEYLNTTHRVIILELKLDKRSATYKALKDKVEFREFVLPKPNARLVFDVYRAAKQDGPKSLAILAKIKSDQDPIMFFGLLVSNAIKDYQLHQGIKEKRALQELSQLDLRIKSTFLPPWLLIESFLLRLSSL